ncbi:hypothetical protein [Mesorhizobium sp. B263B2A]|uniref:hypothetical protein n=1 Tax=Mesorhizobium sp. B263B2A TaxID=2876669 RepID=UPI001CD082D4|nr:hypothetical protein [Mesorhizobium sp. B263B2A]MCA0032701.1 hypothetical protein [Mesorhizobium sp. B263B2A]
MTEAPKHTPGPWSCFYKHKYDEWHVSLPITGSSMKLALCPDGIQSENREADAHLIAAAPDLLAFAEEVRRRCIEMDMPGHELCTLAEAAILRANGGTKP